MLTFSPRTKTSNVSEIMQHSVSVPSSCIETFPDATNGNCTSSHSFCMALHFLDVFVSAFAASSATRIRMASSFSATTTNGLPGDTPRLLTASARAPPCCTALQQERQHSRWSSCSNTLTLGAIFPTVECRLSLMFDVCSFMQRESRSGLAKRSNSGINRSMTSLCHA